MRLIWLPKMCWISISAWGPEVFPTMTMRPPRTTVRKLWGCMGQRRLSNVVNHHVDAAAGHSVDGLAPPGLVAVVENSVGS
jgi:hypothetical protein